MQKEIKMQVTAELAVNVIPNQNYDYVMTTKEVAHAYDVSPQNIREHQRVNDDFIEGKHFIKGVRISDTLGKNAQPHQIFWTKRGIVRLGFFIKSEQAKLFRDWAEDLIINMLEAGENFLKPIFSITLLILKLNLSAILYRLFWQHLPKYLPIFLEINGCVFFLAHLVKILGVVVIMLVKLQFLPNL